jgi:hypothetical protein
MIVEEPPGLFSRLEISVSGEIEMGDPEKTDDSEGGKYRSTPGAELLVFQAESVRSDESWLHGPTVALSIRRLTHRTDQLSNPNGQR